MTSFGSAITSSPRRLDRQAIATQDPSDLPVGGMEQGRPTFLAANQADSALCGNCGEIDLPTRWVSF